MDKGTVNISMEEGLIMETSRDGIATVRMKNGENRLRLSFVKAFNTLLDEIERNTDIKGLIITGTDKYFSLGLDIAYFETQTANYVEETRRMNGELYKRITAFPIPTVAAINGHAYGAGAFIAISCDYRVMRADRGWLCWPEVAMGMVMSQLTFTQIRLKMTPLASRDAFVFGKRFSAQEAFDLQIVDKIAGKEDLEKYAADIILEILGRNGIERRALAQVKQEVYADYLNGELLAEKAKL